MPNENRPDESDRTAGPDDRLRDANEQLTLATLRAQEQSAESAERYRALVEGLDAIVWEAQTDPWRYTFVSRQAEAILGYPVERWLTEPTFWMDVIHPDDRPFAVNACTEAAAARRDFRVEYRAIASDGRIVWSALIARLRQGHDQHPAQYRGLMLDVGDAIRAETLEKLVSQQTAELLGKQEHLRALTTELNLAEHRERTKLSAELHDHLAQMLVLGRLKLGQAKRVAGATDSECAALIHQTDDVLSESLAYTRTLIADLSPPVLREFGLLAALQWLAEQMKRYRLAVRLDAQDSSEPPISEDRAVLLFQSVRELLINVSKHARTGQATVSLRRQSSNVLRLDVRDEGCGFNVADVAINSKTTTALHFGLFTIRERMKTLGGAFEVESAPGEGTTATLILPMAASSEANPGSSEQSISPQLFRSSPPTRGSPQDHRHSAIGVLLVDDHAMLRQGLRSIVDGHHDLRVVGEASNGLEAIDAVRALKPDVVVMDINMPEMNGIEATKRIKEEFPDTAVIGLSVHQGTSIAQTMADAGISSYLTKESAVEALCQAIEDAVSEKR